MNYSVLRACISQIISEKVHFEVVNDLFNLFSLDEVLTFIANTDKELLSIYETVCSALNSDADLNVLSEDETLMYYLIDVSSINFSLID